MTSRRQTAQSSSKSSKKRLSAASKGEKDNKENVSEPEEQYIVESVVRKKVLPSGKVKYFLKWKNWPSSSNTWEPAENLDCPELLEAFEKEEAARVKAEKEAKKEEASRTKSEEKKEETMDKVKTTPHSSKKSAPGPGGSKGISAPSNYGFARGLEADKIVGATDHGGSLKFLMKWKGRHENDIVLAEEANIRCPQVVIKFYESMLTWTKTD